MPPRIIAWRLSTVLWAVHMFWLSTESFGIDHTRFALSTVLSLLHVSVSSHTLWILNAVLRKLAHVTEYAIFGFLLSRSLGSPSRSRSQVYIAALCIAAAAVYSFTDEFHQSFVPGRGPSLIDCAIDVSGAVLAMILLYALPGRSSDRDETLSPADCPDGKLL
ncbi:MAG: VanZ family protein [Acidobacteriia bacterium]|nr:VanZ family protein [Terriglobia bacterium]